MNLIAKARIIYYGINKRCNNEKYHIYRPKYKNISNETNRDEFVEWYVANYFEECQVDRIEDNKNYSMDNIQLLTKREYNSKRKLEIDGVIENGFRKCTGCKTIKEATHENFSTHIKKVSEFNPNGFREKCRECTNEDKRNYYKKQQEIKNV